MFGHTVTPENYFRLFANPAFECQFQNRNLMINAVRHIFNNDCPNCYKGKVFKDKSFFFSVGFPKMYTNCTNCNFQFEKEPGFFFGAMFVNYALTVSQGIITYFIAQQFYATRFDLHIIFIIAVVIILLCFFNIRLSRMIWIYIFKKYSI